jgi:hypothetical protein
VCRISRERFRIEDQADRLLAAACGAVLVGRGGGGSDNEAGPCNSEALEKMIIYIRTYSAGRRSAPVGTVAEESLPVHGLEQCAAVAKPAGIHRRHPGYTYDDLRSVDRTLADEVERLGVEYGYNANCHKR